MHYDISEAGYKVAVPDSLDDWEEVREFWKKFKDGPYGPRIQVTMKELQSYFVGALCNPRQIGFLVGYTEDTLNGMMVVKEVLHPDPLQDHNLVPATFIAGVYVEPRAGLAFSDMFHRALDRWSRERDHRLQTGNARAPELGKNNYKLRAVEHRYGFKLAYQVVERQL